MGVIAAVRRRCALVAFAVATLAPGAAMAQPEPDAATRAREMFERGVQHIADGEPAEAVELLRASMELAPRAATAFNLALALRDAGLLLEGLEVADALVEGRYAELDGEREDQARRLRDQLASRLAQLEVQLSGSDRAELLIDAEPRGELARDAPHVVRLTPGEHVLEARVPDGPSVQERIALAAGERTRVLLHVGPRPLAPAAPTAPVDAGSGISTWVWVGLVAVLVAGGVAAFLLLSADDPEPTVDPVYGQFFTLSAL